MEIFKNKFLIKLIACLCLFLTLFNFSGISRVYADGDDEVYGGVLIRPIVSLLTGIGDAIVEILHKSVQSQDAAIIKVDGNTEKVSTLVKILGAVVAIAAVCLAVVFAPFSAIVAVAATVALAVAVAGPGVLDKIINAAWGAGKGLVKWTGAYFGWLGTDLYLPAFTITPESIFGGTIPLFDVNFFNPDTGHKIDWTETFEYSDEERYPCHSGNTRK